MLITLGTSIALTSFLYLNKLFQVEGDSYLVGPFLVESMKWLTLLIIICS